MIDTFQLTRDCIRMEREGVSDEDMIAYLMAEGLAEPMAIMMVDQARHLDQKMRNGLNKIISGTVATVVGTGLTVFSFNSGASLAVVLYGAIAGGIGLMISGWMDLRGTRHYR